MIQEMKSSLSITLYLRRNGHFPLKNPFSPITNSRITLQHSMSQSASVTLKQTEKFEMIFFTPILSQHRLTTKTPKTEKQKRQNYFQPTIAYIPKSSVPKSSIPNVSKCRHSSAQSTYYLHG